MIKKYGSDVVVIKKISLVDQVYDKLRRSIVTMQIPLGTRLNVSKIQKEYGVSSTPIREAMNRLLNEGLLEFENNVGARVVMLSEQDVQERLEISVGYEMASFCFGIEKSEGSTLAKDYEMRLAQYKASTNAAEYHDRLTKLKDVMHKGAKNQSMYEQIRGDAVKNELLYSIFCVDSEESDVAIYHKFTPYFEQVSEAIAEKNIEKGINALQNCDLIVNKYIIKKLRSLCQ